MRKCVYTLILPGYPEQITNITLPWIKYYAEKIGADFKVISERKSPQWPPTYEKLQIYDLGKEYDWNIYIDADALISPEMFDVTAVVPMDTVMFTGKDFAPMRSRPDKYFLRDGRYIGACNWFCAASNWCLDLWHPVDDMTPEELVNNLFRVIHESCGGYMQREQLIDDYVLSRNIARFGLKHTTIEHDIKRKFDRPGDSYYFHLYAIDPNEKLHHLEERVKGWKLEVYKP